MKITLTAAQRKAGCDLRDVIGPLRGRTTTPKTPKTPKRSKSTPVLERFRGAQVVRGLGMKPNALDALVSRHAYAEFPDTVAYLVLEDHALADGGSEPRLFAKLKHAIRYARARSHGNVDHRVLRVTDQVLVIGTRNKL